LLLGARSERRPGEAFAKAVYRFINPLLPKPWKGIYPEQVAEAMLQLAASETEEPLRVVSNKDMLR
jgi:hypothetical protein